MPPSTHPAPYAQLVVCDTGLVVDHAESTIHCFGGLSVLPWWQIIGWQWAVELPALIVGAGIGVMIVMALRKIG